MSFHMLSRNNNSTNKVSEQNISIKNIVSLQKNEDKNETKNIMPQSNNLNTAPASTKDTHIQPVQEKIVKPSLEVDDYNDKNYEINNIETPKIDSKVQNKNFTCDGRIYCSQMTSCEEATFFLQNCPNTKMDGGKDGQAPDGIPCESQWCN